MKTSHRLPLCWNKGHVMKPSGSRVEPAERFLLRPDAGTTSETVPSESGFNSVGASEVIRELSRLQMKVWKQREEVLMEVKRF